MGTYYDASTLTNHARNCSLVPGRIQLVSRSRHLAALRLSRRPRLILRQGEAVLARLSHSDDANLCDADDHRRDPVRLVLAGAVLASGDEPLVRCAGAWGLTIDRVITSQTNRTGPFVSLRARVIGGSKRLEGDNIHFQVALVNGGAHRFDFHRCPSYTEVISPRVGTGRSVTTRSRYRLSCRDAGSITAGSHRTFDMVAPVSRAADRRRHLDIEWSMDDGPVAYSRLTISR